MQSVIDHNGILEIPSDPNVEVIAQGVGVYLFNKMKGFSKKIAQIDTDTNDVDTHGDILIKSIRVAIKMKSLGVTDGDVISLYSGLHRHACLPFWAALFMGAYSANLDPAILLNTKIVVFFDKDTCHIPFEEFLKPQEGENEYKPKIAKSIFDTALIVFTSGISGQAKGVCLTHYGMWYSLNLVSDYTAYKSVLFYTPPNGISYSVSLTIPVMIGGQRIIFKYDEKTMLKIIQDYKVTYIYMTPPLTYGLTSTENMKSNFDLSSLIAMGIGGDRIDVKQLEKLNKRFINVRISQVYGLTEVAGRCSMWYNSDDPELIKTKRLSCGKMMPGTTCKIIDVDTKETVGPNKPGELLIKTMRMMNGYYNEPEKTAEAFDEDGFFRSGDILYYDEDYCFYTLNRLKSMIKYKSWEINPVELENILLSNPAVREALVVVCPNKENDDQLVAVIVLFDEVNITENEIIEHFNSQVSDLTKLRGGVKFVKDLPKTSAGKYCRRILREMVMNNEIK